MSHKSYAFRQAGVRAQAEMDVLAAEEQFAADRLKKAVGKHGKSGKPRETEYVCPSEKEMRAWRKQVAAELEGCAGHEAARRRDIEEDEAESRSWITSWRRDRVAHQAKKEACRVGRGIVTHSAKRRLARELVKLEGDPSWGVAATPVDTSLQVWHCNVSAPGGLTGKGVLHLELRFPNEYPAVPPAVAVLGADVVHPNVFGDYICLDMLDKGEFEADCLQPYTGWSAAYGVQAMLRQLQSFFFSGADAGDTRGRIRITPHSGREVWEYQLNWDEVQGWRDWDYDPYSFCQHRYARPGHCGLFGCDSTGLYGPRWVAMHRADCGRLERAYQEGRAAAAAAGEEEKEGADTAQNNSNSNNNSAGLPLPAQAPAPVRFNDMCFARKIKRKGFRMFVTVHRAEGLVGNSGLYHEDNKYGGKPYWTWHPYVSVAGKNVDHLTQPASMHVQMAEEAAARGPARMVKEAGPSSAVWRETVSFQVDGQLPSGGYAIDFAVHDAGPAGGNGNANGIGNGSKEQKPVLLGKAQLRVDKLAEGEQMHRLVLQPGLQQQEGGGGRGTGSAKAMRKGGTLGALWVSVRTSSPKEDTGYEYDFSPQGVDGTFEQTSLYTGGTRRIRRRQGYRCKVCDHTPIKPNPPLPCAIECDDAPPFALEEFHRTAQTAAGDNPAARQAVARTMAALQEELAAGEEEEEEEKKKKQAISKIFTLPHTVIGVVMDFLPRMRERRYMAHMWPSWTGVYESARYWEAQHLRCFTTGAGPEEEVLGVGVLAGEAANGRPVFSCQFDAVSKTAYEEGVRIGVWKEKFTHWIPLYIDREHAGRAMPMLLKMVRQLAVGVRSANSAWTVCGGGLDGAGKGALKRVRMPVNGENGAGDPSGNAAAAGEARDRHMFRSTGWAGLRGGHFCASGTHYFQVQVGDYSPVGKMLIGGKVPALGSVKVGWATQTGDVNLGTDRYGFCYSTAGHKVHAAEREAYGPRIAPGDVVGTLFDARDRTITYYLNGTSLGAAFTVPRTGEYAGLIPCVAMNCASMEVDIAGGYDAPIQVDRATLGAHQRTVEQSIAGCVAVLPQLMNHMVTEVMKGTLFASVKALQGYCALHRLLLHCCDTVPGLLDTVDATIERFVRHPEERHKVVCPDLGMLLALLTVSKRFWWSDLKDAFLTELFARHVRWSLKKSRRFQAGTLLPENTRDEHMCDEAFYANETSCKLVMFQVFFCRLVKPPRRDEEKKDADADTDTDTDDDEGFHNDDPFHNTKLHYDARMGFPTKEMVAALSQQMGVVNRVAFKKWNGFFANIGAKQRTPHEIAKKLCEAVERSDRAGYHADVKMLDEEASTKILRRTPRHPLPFTQRGPPQRQRFFRNEFPEDERFLYEDRYACEDFGCE